MVNVKLFLPPTLYISVDLAHHEIFRAKVGKGYTKCYFSVRVENDLRML